MIDLPSPALIGVIHLPALPGSACHRLTMDEIVDEFRKRVMILQWMIEEGIRDYRSVSSIVRAYYQNPSEVLKKVTPMGETA